MKKALTTFFLAGVSAFAQTANLDVFLAGLSSANEVPPIAGLNASGTAVLWVHTVRDASGEIISGSVDFNVYYTFPGDTTFVGLHIHNGPVGVNAGVVIGTDLGAGAASVNDPTGRGNIRRQVQVSPDNATALAALRGLFTNTQGYYVNLHTTVNTGGAIRGQVYRADWTVLLGRMSPLNEVPAIPDYNASAVGVVNALRALDSEGRFQAGFVSFDADYRFPEQVTFVGFHIHNGPAGVNAGVVINTGIAAGAASVTTPANGQGSLSYGVPIEHTNAPALAALYGLFDNPAGYYINLHTTTYTGGAIRSQMIRPERARFNVVLSPANEVPPIAIEASAPALYDIAFLRGADGAATAGRFLFDVNARFPGRVEFIGLHIHDGVAGVNGGVTMNSGLSAARSVVMESGFGNIMAASTFDSGSALATMNSLLSNPENHYMNLHSTVNTGGVVRSQLAPGRTALPVIRDVISAVSDPTLKTGGQGGLITIFGNNLAKVPSDLGGLTAATVPTTLNGTSVTIGGSDAPIVSIGLLPALNPPDYIVAQIPFGLAAGNQSVVVRSANGASQPWNTAIASTAPGIYFDSVGAIAFKATNLSLIRPENPATSGDMIGLYVTGLGQTSPALSTGQITPPTGIFAPSATITATLGGRPAAVAGSGAVPGFIGTYAVVIRVPDGLTAGNAAAQIRIGDVASNSAPVAVR